MTWMLLLTIGFTAIFGYLYIQLSKEESLFSSPTRLLLLLLLFGLVIRLIYAAQAEGYPADIAAFKRWSEYSFKNGLLDLYSGKTYADYPPGYMYILYLLGGVRTLFSIDIQSVFYTILIKLPSIFSDLAIAVILYKFFSDKWNHRLALFVSAICLLNPGVIVNSSLWGQTDSFLTMWLLLSFLFMIKGRLSLAASFLAIAVLVKPQGLLFGPILLAAYFVKKDHRAILYSILSGAGVFLLSVFMFLPRYGLYWVLKLYMGTAMQFPYASLNAYNLHTLLGGNFKPDRNILFILSYRSWGFIFLGMVITYAMLLFIKSKKMQTAALSACVLMCGVFTLAPAMHERYLFPAVILLLLAYGVYKDIRLLVVFFIFSATSFLNQVQILLQILRWIPVTTGNDPILISVCIINIVSTFYLFYIAFDIAIRERVLI